MKNVKKHLSIAFGLVILAGLLAAQNADADAGSCYLKATNTDVFMIVFDLDLDGNQGDQIWQGRINRGESVKITVPHGRFRYDYNSQPDQDQPLSGGFDRSCSNLETILVP
jgi:hypothetical protein